MKMITEAAKDVNVLCETDVVVVGGGPSGIGAALAAARNGAKTVLIENYGFLGGVQTLTYSNSFSWLDKWIQGGIVQEIVNRLEESNATYESNPGAIRDHWDRNEGVVCFDGEYYKYLLDSMMQEAGVKLLYHTIAVGTINEGKTIKGVIIESHQGRNIILAKTVLDCTGSGNIARKAGAKMIGEEGYPDNRFGPFKGRHMGLGYGLFLRGLDYKKFREFAEQNVEEWDHWVRGRELFLRYKAEGKLYSNRNSLLMNEYADGRVWLLGPMYPVAAGRHPWETEVMSDGEIDMRKQCWSVYKMFKESVPGFENTKIEQTPTRLLLRDGYRLDAEYILTEDDMRSARSFDDAITCTNMPSDVFFPNASHHFKFDITPYDIPYRSMITKDFDNLMAVGGSAGSDIVTWSAVRYATPNVCTGQAAGTAAAMAAKVGKTIKDIDVKELQKNLNKQGLVTSNKQVPTEVIERYKLRTKIWSTELVL